MIAHDPLPPVPGLPDILLGLVADFVFVVRVNAAGLQSTEWSSRSFESLTGYTREEMDAFGGWFMLVREDERDLVLHTFREAVAGRHASSDFGFRTRAGELRLVTLNLSTVRDASGVVTHLCGAVQDRTARAAADEALASRERMLSEVLDALPLGVWTIDRDGRVQSVNAAGRRIWGGGYTGIPSDEDFQPTVFDWPGLGRR